MLAMFALRLTGPRRNLYSCPQDVKETAYKGLITALLTGLFTSLQVYNKFTSLFHNYEVSITET